MKKGIQTLVTLALVSVSLQGFAQKEPVKGERALYLSGNQTLMGCIYRPSGKGPFPAIVFNQSVPKPLNQSGPVDPYPALARIFVGKGYIFFAPGRHAPGKIEEDEKGNDSKLVLNHEKHAVNIAAAVEWVKAQHDVDEKRVAVIGEGAGGVSSLFALNKGMEVKALVVFSPGVKRLKSNYEFQVRLKDAVQYSSAPIFLIQPENDLNLSSRTILGSILDRKGSPNRVKIYPPFGGDSTSGNEFVMEGHGVWQRDVLAFLEQTMN